jgi:NADH-quinone oxidoreductase subunit G
MLGAVLQEYYRDPKRSGGKRVVTVSVMPCTAKKAEILRPESFTDGRQDVDYAITTGELAQMIEQSGLGPEDCSPAKADAPFGEGSGGAVIFGVTGGVMEAVLRYLLPKLGIDDRDWISSIGVRSTEAIRELSVEHEGQVIRAAIVSGLRNADELIQRINGGEAHYDIIEVMACPGGCIMGGGQPDLGDVRERINSARRTGLYLADEDLNKSKSDDNKAMQKLYDTLLKGKEHKLLHRNFV